MIRKVNGIDNAFLKHNYSEMVDSMFENVADISKGFGKNIAKKAKKVSLVDSRTFNFFGMYSKEVYCIYKEVCISIKEAFKENDINFERSFPYIYARILDNKNIPLGVDLDMAPSFRTTFWGFYVISSSNDLIFIDGKEIVLEPGLIMIMSSSQKAMFNNISDDLKVVYINISPLEYLHRQYYQKWIPII
jgi:hypothetical protein